MDQRLHRFIINKRSKIEFSRIEKLLKGSKSFWFTLYNSFLNDLHRKDSFSGFFFLRRRGQPQPSWKGQIWHIFDINIKKKVVGLCYTIIFSMLWVCLVFNRNNLRSGWRADIYYVKYTYMNVCLIWVTFHNPCLQCLKTGLEMLFYRCDGFTLVDNVSTINFRDV